MAVAALSVHEYGDAGLLVHVEVADPEVRWSVAQGLARSLQSSPPPGFTDLVASFADLFVAFDPLVTDHAAFEDTVRRRVGAVAGLGLDPREYLVPVVYGGEFGPDLDGVADELGVTPEQVVDMHSGTPWTVRLCGAPAGAPMMDGPRMPAPVARRAEPRVRVESGSVAISGFQSVIYPVASPGGWRLIGRTPAELVDARRDPIVEYRPGDRLRFVPVPAGSWTDWRGPLGELTGRLRDARGEVGAGA